MSDFFTWYNYEASEQDKMIADKVSQFESLFDDMVFENYDDLDSDSYFPDELRYFDISNYRFKAMKEESDFHLGEYKDNTIFINPKYINDDSVIIHEMIHLFEDNLNSIGVYFYHDILLWNLYSKLKPKISKLDEIIESHTEIYNINDIGGMHDILFLLKSFDLDIRLGYDLGTVFGYGRLDDFKDYTYVKE